MSQKVLPSAAAVEHANATSAAVLTLDKMHRAQVGRCVAQGRVGAPLSRDILDAEEHG